MDRLHGNAVNVHLIKWSVGATSFTFEEKEIAVLADGDKIVKICCCGSMSYHLSPRKGKILRLGHGWDMQEIAEEIIKTRNLEGYINGD